MKIIIRRIRRRKRRRKEEAKEGINNMKGRTECKRSQKGKSDNNQVRN